MTKEQILIKIKTLKQSLQKDGFTIDGIFGSYARGDYTSESDVDILYHLDKLFFDKYKGFVGFKRLEEVKRLISDELGRKVDLAPRNNLSKTGKKYILKDVIYV